MDPKQYFIDLETMGLQSSFGPRRALGITEFAVREAKSGKMEHWFSNLLQSDVEKHLQGKTTVSQLIDAAMTPDRPLHFTGGVLVKGDVEQQVFANAITGTLKGLKGKDVLLTEHKVIDKFTNILEEVLAEKGATVGGWNVGFDFEELVNTSRRIGNKKFEQLYALAKDQKKIVDYSEGAQRFLYETFIADGDNFKLLHRELPSRLGYVNLDNLLDPKSEWMKKAIVPHGGFENLRQNLDALSAASGLDLRDYDQFREWSQRAKANKALWEYQSFAQGLEVPEMRFTASWGTSTLTDALGKEKVMARVAKRADLSLEQVRKMGLHDPRFDVVLTQELADIFGKYTSRDSGQKFAQALQTSYGFKDVESFKKSLLTSTQRNVHGLWVKHYANKYQSRATKLGRVADKSHIEAILKGNFENARIEGEAIKARELSKVHKYLPEWVPGGFKNAIAEIWEESGKWSKKHPKAAMWLGVGAAAFLIDSIIPSKKAKKVEPYSYIQGQRMPQTQWDRYQGIRRSDMQPVSEFGTGRDWFKQIDKARRIFAGRGLFEAIDESTHPFYKFGWQSAKFEVQQAHKVDLQRRISHMFRRSDPLNYGPIMEIQARQAKEPLQDMVEFASRPGASFKRYPHSSIHASMTSPIMMEIGEGIPVLKPGKYPGAWSPLKKAVHTPQVPYTPVYHSPLAKELAAVRRDANIVDRGMEIAGGPRPIDLTWTKPKFAASINPIALAKRHVYEPIITPVDRLPPRSMRQVAMESEAEISEHLFRRFGERLRLQQQPHMTGLMDERIRFSSKAGVTPTQREFMTNYHMLPIDASPRGIPGVKNDYHMLPAELRPDWVLGINRPGTRGSGIPGIRRSGTRGFEVMNRWPYGDFPGGRDQLWGSKPFEFISQFEDLFGGRIARFELRSKFVEKALASMPGAFGGYDLISDVNYVRNLSLGPYTMEFALHEAIHSTGHPSRLNREMASVTKAVFEGKVHREAEEVIRNVLREELIVSETIRTMGVKLSFDSKLGDFAYRMAARYRGISSSGVSEETLKAVNYLSGRDFPDLHHARVKFSFPGFVGACKSVDPVIATRDIRRAFRVVYEGLIPRSNVAPYLSEVWEQRLRVTLGPKKFPEFRRYMNRLHGDDWFLQEIKKWRTTPHDMPVVLQEALKQAGIPFADQMKLLEKEQVKLEGRIIGRNKRFNRKKKLYELKDGARLGGWLLGEATTVGEHFTKQHFEKLVTALNASGYSKQEAEWMLVNKYRMSLEPHNRVIQPAQGAKSVKLLKRVTNFAKGGFKGMFDAARTLLSPTFIKHALKAGAIEAKAYPKLFKSIYKMNLPGFERMWMFGGQTIGVGGLPPSGINTAIELEYIKGPRPPEAVFKKGPTGQQIAQSKLRLGRQIMLASRKISGGTRGTTPQGFAQKLGTGGLMALGKAVKYGRGMTLLNTAFLGMHMLQAGTYNFLPGGMATEAAAFVGTFAAWQAAATVSDRAIESGIVNTLAKGGKLGKLPLWAKGTKLLGSQIIGTLAANVVSSVIREVGYSIFGVKTPPMQAGVEPQQIRPDYWNAHITYSSMYAGYNAFDGMNVSGMNLTPFGSSYSADKVPELAVPQRRPKIKRKVFPRTAGLVQTIWSQRRGSRYRDQTRRIMAPARTMAGPMPRHDRGVAA